MISVELVSDAEALKSLEPGWDDLATRSRAPYCSPGWALAWWRHMADPRSALRIVVVREGEDVVGLAPFFTLRDFGVARYGLLAADVSFPVDPLAAPGYERSVANSVVDTVAGTEPKPDLVSLDGTLATTRWAEMLAGAWPGGAPHVRRVRTLPSPTLVLHGRTYEEWLASKSSNFRQQMKRFRRRLERKGATFRLATDPTEVERGLRAFLAMHHARWGTKGGSNLAKPGLHAMLRSVAARFAGSLRFRLWLLEADGSIVSAQIFVEAGGDVAYWNGGFDQAWAAERPAIQTILAAVEHAFSVGDRRVSFGGGAHEYKSRFADDGEEDLLEWTTLLPITPRYPLARLRLVPGDIRTTVSNRLSETSKQRLRSLWGHRSTQGAKT
jgi:CelD/BcsL family acetyltransferase involved in cellulose biosynthesis